jgi:hypothetical protein
MSAVATVPRRVLSTLCIESLAAAVRLRGRDDPGQRFAKLGIRGDGDKHVARLRARDAMNRPEFRSFLTMPGLFFAFEWLLLGKRERGRVFADKRRRPEKTWLTCIEREPEIWRGGIKYMPHLDHGHIKMVPTLPGAKNSIRAPFVFRYHEITFEDYVAAGMRFDAAFLDFNGPLSLARCAAIRTFWTESHPAVLVVNSQQGRYRDGWNAEIAFEELCGACDWSWPVDDFAYGQFRQLIFERK